MVPDHLVALIAVAFQFVGPALICIGAVGGWVWLAICFVTDGRPYLPEQRK